MEELAREFDPIGDPVRQVSGLPILPHRLA